MKVFAYIRVSGKGQVEGDGPERQRQAIESFCKTHGLEVIGDPWADLGVSGTKECLDRPAFAEMLLTYKEAGVKAIVVERADRLARDNMTAELLLRECRDRKLKVFCADRDLTDISQDDPANPSATLIRQIFFIIAQWEKSATVLKLRCARVRAAKAAGGKCEGQKHYGFFEAERIVRNLAVQLQGTGNSYKDIADLLNQGGHTTRSKAPWTRFSVRDIITQRNVKHKQNT